MFFSNVFEGLYGHDLDGKLTPELAVSYEQSDDGLTYTFKLRPDVKFHNGDPLTAEDVRFPWKRSNDPQIKNPRAGIVPRNIEDVEVVDPPPVKVHLTAPNHTMTNKRGEQFY